MLKGFPYIYKLTLLRDTESFRAGQVYIGQHNGKNRSYFTGGHIPRRIIGKYGRSVFKKEIIARGDFNSAFLDELERHYIRLYNSNSVGLNIESGGKKGENGKRASIPIYQYTREGVFIREYPDVFSAGKDLGRSCQRIAEVARKNLGIAYGFQWRYYKLAAIPPYYRRNIPVYQYSVDGDYMESFVNVREAAIKNGIGAVQVYKLITAPKTSTRGKLRFSFVKEDRLGRIGTEVSLHAYDLMGNYVRGFEYIRDIPSWIGHNVAHGNIIKWVDTANRKCYGFQWRTYKTDNCGKYVSNINTHKKRAVLIINVDGSFNIFDSRVTAAEAIGIPASSIDQICRGRRVNNKYPQHIISFLN